MTMMHVALRNLLRNRKRSVLNAIALITGGLVLLLGLGWVQGYHSQIYDSLIRLETGHAQFVAQGYLEEERRLPLDRTIGPYRQLREILANHSAVEGVSGRMDFPLKIASGSTSLRLIGRGFDPAAERSVSSLGEHIERGRYPDGGPGLLLGHPVAEALQVVPGDMVFLTARDVYGNENSIDAGVSGIFNFGYPAMDRNLAYLDLDSVADLLSTGDQVNRLVVRLKPGINEKGFTDSAPDLPAAGTWWPWKRFARTAVAAVEADSGGFYGMIAIMYLLVGLGILNSLSMTVHERTREIGTLKALGWRPGRIRSLFLHEALLLSMLSSLLSTFLALPLMYWLQELGIPIGSSMPADLPVPFGERFHADFRIWHVLAGAGLGLAVSLAGAWMPAHRASRMNITEALRTRG